MSGEVPNLNLAKRKLS